MRRVADCLVERVVVVIARVLERDAQARIGGRGDRGVDACAVAEREGGANALLDRSGDVVEDVNEVVTIERRAVVALIDCCA